MPETNPILVTRSSMPPLEEYIDEISSLWESHWLTNMGEKHKKFQDLLCKYLGVPNTALFTNGHSALECIFEAMQLGADGRAKVITTPFTFASTTHAIVRKGLQPVFADIKLSDYTLDPASIESLIDEEVCAIVPVHVYGNICDIKAIERIAQKYHLKVIYDAAHAFGVKVNGQSVARFGDASMFSFHATKVFNTIEGGAICFKNPQLLEVLNQWKNFGITGPESVEYVGGNAKMNEFCAAMGICNLRHLDEEIYKRKEIANRYWERLGSIEELEVHIPDNSVEHNYAYMPILFKDSFGSTRNEVFEALANNNIKARKYFYPLVTDFACYAGKFDSTKTPHAQYVADRILTLPLYSDLPINYVDKICDIVISCRH